MLVTAAAGCSAFKKIERHPDVDEPFVEGTLALSLEGAAAAVRATFGPGGSASATTTPPLDSFELYSIDHPIVPSHWELQAHAERNPALKRYLELPVGARRTDFFLGKPTARFSWPSEYTWNGRVAEFRCDFILHLEAVPGGTRVEVIEYLPTVQVGKKFGFPHDAILPGMIYDMRFVEPTTRDRRAVLAAILSR